MGAPVEMNEPGMFEPLSGMVGGGYFKLLPGEWTDDTALALCSAASLSEKGIFDPKDHLVKFLRWWREGYMSTRSEAFGIGMVTAGALMRFESTGEDFCGPTGEKTASNGSLMHIATVPLAYAHNPCEAIHLAAEASRLTHGAKEAIDACRYLTSLIVGAIRGYHKSQLLVSHFDYDALDVWQEDALTARIAHIADGTFKDGPPAISWKNYTDAAVALHAALWGFYSTDTFKDGLLSVVNLGWDADTMGTVYGQLAGAYYGEGGIPAEWSGVISKSDTIISFADALHALAQKERPAKKRVG